MAKTNLVRLNSAGEVDTLFDAKSATGCENGFLFRQVDRIAVERKGRLLVNLVPQGGRPCSDLLRIHEDGSLDEAFTDPSVSGGAENVPRGSGERFVSTIKDSCLDNMVLFGESALREAASQFVEHYHQEHNHQGLENKIIRPDFAEFPHTGTIRSRRRLGGLLRHYRRDAA